MTPVVVDEEHVTYADEFNRVTRFTKYEDLPELLTPDEARQFLGLGKTGIYEAIRTGTLPSLRFGRLIRVPRSALRPDAIVSAPARGK